MKKNRKRQAKKEPTKTAKPAVAATDTEKDWTLDFGGLPERNLKKNLGCG